MVLTDRGVAYAEPLCGRLVYASVFHVLSCLLCFAARFAGLEERMLEPPVYHIEHGQGSGFAGYSSGDRWKQLERGGIARIMPEDYMTMVHDMREGRRPLVINGEDWGLGGEDLAEASPEARS